MEVPLTVWADIMQVVLCFMAIIICEKVWRWLQQLEIKVEKPKHQVSLPELVTTLVQVTETTKPEEETENFVDAPEQSTVTRPKVLAVAPQHPNKDPKGEECGEQPIPNDWDTTPLLPGQPTYMDTNQKEQPSYASTSGRGGPIVYDWEGLSQEQQIILEDLRRC